MPEPREWPCCDICGASVTCRFCTPDDDPTAENVELRERLAAAEALLRQVRAKGNTREPIPLRLWDDIDAFLAAGGVSDA